MESLLLFLALEIPKLPHTIGSIVGNSAYIFNATAFMVKDILYLRIFAVFASTMNITYRTFGLEQTVWLDIGWQATFLLINLTRIGLIVKDMMGIKFTKEEKLAFDEIFSNFKPVDFNKFIHAAEFKTLKRGKTITEQGKPVEKLTLIFKGGADVRKDYKKLAHLQEYAFVGEMAFTTKKPAYATVVMTEDTKVFQWDFEALKKLLRHNTTMRISFQGSVGADMAQKLGIPAPETKI